MKSLVVILVLFGIGLPVSGAGLNPSVARVLGRDSTLTGRADTWRELVDVAMRHPLFGCSFDSYWTPQTRELHRMSHGHNAYLEIFNELSVCGLALFSMYLLSLAGATAQTSLTDPNWARLCVAYLFTALTHGVAESSINSFSSIIGGRCCLLAAHAWRPIGLPAEAVNRVVPGRKLRPKSRQSKRHADKKLYLVLSGGPRLPIQCAVRAKCVSRGSTGNSGLACAMLSTGLYATIVRTF